MLTKIQFQNLDQTSANIVILLIWSKRNKRITSRVLWNVRARACYTCEHVLPTRASTCFLHVRARYLFVRARLLFKNVHPGLQMFHLVFVKSTTQTFASDLAKCSGYYLLATCEKVAIMVRYILWLTWYRFHDTLNIFINNNLNNR